MDVIERLQKEWRRFRNADPGRRFRDFYNRRKSRRRRRWTVVRGLRLGIGIVLMIVGPIVGLVPGPGGILVFGLGLLLVGAEFRPVARLLDWAEPKLHRAWAPVQRFWVWLPAAGKVISVLIAVAAIAASAYLSYTFVLG